MLLEVIDFTLLVLVARNAELFAKFEKSRGRFCPEAAYEAEWTHEMTRPPGMGLDCPRNLRCRTLLAVTVNGQSE